MKNWGKIIIVLVIIAIIAGAIVAIVMVNKNAKEKSSLKIESSEDLKDLIEDVYEKVGKPKLMVDTMTIDVSDDTMVSSVTGLENGDDFEYLVVSEPLTSSQPYSFVLGKVKSGVNSNKVAKDIFENINPRKWICVSADKVCVTSSGDVVCLIMTDKENTDKIYKGFKEIAGSVGKEYSKDVEEEELPPDMMFPGFEIPEDTEESGEDLYVYGNEIDSEFTEGDEHPVDSNVTNSVTE